MQQVEILSWATLDALRQAATRVFETIGDIDTDEQMSVFCAVEDDYLELFYSEVDANFFRHFEDEEELFKYIQIRKNDAGEDDYEAVDYYEDDENFDENGGEDFSDYSGHDEDEDDY